jgi:hypothetical protein
MQAITPQPRYLIPVPYFSEDFYLLFDLFRNFLHIIYSVSWEGQS